MLRIKVVSWGGCNELQARVRRFSNEILSWIESDMTCETQLSSRTRTLMRSLIVLALVGLWAEGVRGNIFEQFFQGAQQQQAPPPPSFGPSAYRSLRDSSTPSLPPPRTYDPVPCEGYLCPTTLECVKKESECDCPLVQDVRCLIGGTGETVCARECEGVKLAARGI